MKREPSGDINQVPHSISFQFFNIKKKEVTKEVAFKIKEFGYDPKTLISSHLINKVKSALSNLHNKTGDPKTDID